MIAPPRILLADCDQMFVAVARLVDPEGAGKARLLVVGGTADSRGVVCSASYEVRTFGVRSGMPIAQAARLCPNATFVPVPRGACGKKGREVAQVLDRWAPKVEPASIDEFYLDLSGTEAVYHGEPLARTAERIRADVHDRSGLTVSIGGGTNRLIAKLATERAKPRPGTGATGVLIVAPGDEAEFLASHQLADIPGVGPRLQGRLRQYGLVSVRDALRVERSDLIGWFGDRTGEWLHQRIRGQAGSVVEPDGEAKSMSREETFAKDLSSDRELDGELLRLVTRLTADLRGEGLLARCFTVKLRDHDFRTRQASRTVAAPLDTGPAAYAVAKELLATLRSRRRVAARLVGITASRLEPVVTGEQLSLLAGDVVPEQGREKAIAGALDRINARFGPDALKPAILARRSITRR